jgi:NADH:ubiquinone oxidoreductase subunit 3 (subunit A)
MKLRLFFMLFDILILMAYPIAYVLNRLRRMKGVK